MDASGLTLEAGVYACRLMGMRVEEIARNFGITEDEADSLIEARAGRIRAKTVAAPDVVFALELDRLDEILFGIYPHAKEGRKDAVDSFCKLGDRRDKLMGLHLESTRRQFLDPSKNDDLSDLSDEELKVFEAVAKRRAAAQVQRRR